MKKDNLSKSKTNKLTIFLFPNRQPITDNLLLSYTPFAILPSAAEYHANIGNLSSEQMDPKRIIM